MFCRRVKNNLSAYLQGELEQGTANLIEAHLTKCPSCRNELETIQDGIQMAHQLQIVPAPEELSQSIQEQIRKHKIPVQPKPERAFISRWGLVSGIAALIAILIWLSRRSDEKPNMTISNQWSVNATVMEACSCPMFCQCYFNTKPAGHGHHGKVEHFCRTNIAYRINKGKYGSETLDGIKFWLAGDVGSDFSGGQTDWAVLYFDPSLTPRQREAAQTILSSLMPVKWRSFKTAEAKIDRWEWEKDHAYATLNGGDTAVIQLKRFQGMTGEPVVIQNLKYWAAPRNDGFLLMQNELQAYRIGPQAFEYKGTAGLVITFDMNSQDLQKKKLRANRFSDKGIQLIF